jgi:hypothetical protein
MSCQCAWCGIMLSEVTEPCNCPVSHGICLECAQAVLATLPSTSEHTHERGPESKAA